MATQVVDREIADVYLVLGLLSVPLEWLWGALGLILTPTWLPLGCPWVPWVSRGNPLGVPEGALGCPIQFSQICRKLDAQLRANKSICTRLRIESSLPPPLGFLFAALGPLGDPIGSLGGP